MKKNLFLLGCLLIIYSCGNKSNDLQNESKPKNDNTSGKTESNLTQIENSSDSLLYSIIQDKTFQVAQDTIDRADQLFSAIKSNFRFESYASINNTIAIENSLGLIGEPIPQDKARSLVANYTNFRITSNDNSRVISTGSICRGLEHSVYFSLKEITNWMSQFDVSTYPNKGIRIYFGKYDTLTSPKNEYNNRKTLVLRAMYVPSGTEPSPSGKNSIKIPATAALSTSSVYYDLGGLCPPDCSNNVINCDIR